VSARRKARRRALDILFSADITETPLDVALDRARIAAQAETARASSWGYAQEIVAGVLDHSETLDALISRTSTSWPLDRMPAVDRALVRLGAWEILYNPDVPSGVAIAEAVAMAGELSTEASAGFVHGILASIAENSDPA
jgi:transcription antitermination protein NusB